MDKDIISTSVVATADDNFHATWGVLITTWPEAVGIGVFYTDFDTATEKWTRRSGWRTIIPRIRSCVSTRSTTISSCVKLAARDGVKNIYVQFRKTGQTAWTDDINVCSMRHAMSATNPMPASTNRATCMWYGKRTGRPGTT